MELVFGLKWYFKNILSLAYCNYIFNLWREKNNLNNEQWSFCYEI